MSGFIIASFIGVATITFSLYLSYRGRGWIAKFDSPPYSFDDIPNLSGKTALVTGVNTGIGYFTIRELARKGAYVIGTVRSTDKAEATRRRLLLELGESYKDLISLRTMDLSSFKSIQAFSSDLVNDGKTLDMVILNAGVMSSGYSVTKDGYEMMIGVNHLGHFLLVRSIEKLLDAQKGCRLVHVSSIAHNFVYKAGLDFNTFRSNEGYQSFIAYGQSKLANILFSNELARRYEGTKITSNALHPGSIKTDLGRNVMSSFDENMRNMLTKLVNLLLLMMDTADGALTQLFVATSPKVEGITGKYYEPIGMLLTPSIHARNVTLQEQLWEYSENAIKEYLL